MPKDLVNLQTMNTGVMGEGEGEAKAERERERRGRGRSRGKGRGCLIYDIN